MDMRLNGGDIISIDGVHYVIKGRLEFKSKSGGAWIECSMSRLSDGVNFWLSVDDKCLLWEVLSSKPDVTGYEKIESGTEIVTGAYGDVDCEDGDKAEYEDYCNKADGFYVSIEKWDDETEYSSGSKVDPSKIELVRKGEGETEKKKSKSKSWIFYLLLFVGFLAFKFCGSSSTTPPTVESGLTDNENYTLETSLTGADKDYAQVFSSLSSVDYVVKEIITHIEGNTTQVIENPVDSASVMIITPEEYCIVYTDSITQKTLIHLCDKEWMDANSSMPLYHATACTDDFAKSLHIYNAHGGDSLEKSNSSRHHHYRSHAFSAIFFSSMRNSGRYNDYSNSVRQSSVSSRRSSGGGHGGGGK